MATVYLDICAMNRPFDDQRLLRNRLEAESVIAILELIETGEHQLISSAALLYENMRNPLLERQEYVATYLNLATIFVAATSPVLQQATVFENQGIKPLDALHLASAVQGQAEVFITCDDHILKWAQRTPQFTPLTIATPIAFVVD